MLKSVEGITSCLSPLFRSAVIAIFGSGKKQRSLVNETVLGACSGGVWKLVMKMDGKKVFFRICSFLFVCFFSPYKQNTQTTRLP